MSDNKKYYYLKLKENFFESDAMMILESMQDGYLYATILLKMYLKSLKNCGKLMYSESIPYNSAMLSTILRVHSGIIEKAIRIFKELQLIEILENGSIYLCEIQNFIGESSTEADRIRNFRKSIQEEKAKIENQSVITKIENQSVITKIENQSVITKIENQSVNNDSDKNLNNSLIVENSIINQSVIKNLDNSLIIEKNNSRNSLIVENSVQMYDKCTPETDRQTEFRDRVKDKQTDVSGSVCLSVDEIFEKCIVKNSSIIQLLTNHLKSKTLDYLMLQVEYVNYSCKNPKAYRKLLNDAIEKNYGAAYKDDKNANFEKPKNNIVSPVKEDSKEKEEKFKIEMEQYTKNFQSFTIEKQTELRNKFKSELQSNPFLKAVYDASEDKEYNFFLYAMKQK